MKKSNLIWAIVTIIVGALFLILFYGFHLLSMPGVSYEIELIVYTLLGIGCIALGVYNLIKAMK